MRVGRTAYESVSTAAAVRWSQGVFGDSGLATLIAFRVRLGSWFLVGVPHSASPVDRGGGRLALGAGCFGQ